MIQYKTVEEMVVIQESANILARTHGEVAKWVRPDVSTERLDNIAEEYIKDCGGIPSFKNYNGFPSSLCISVNETVVHGMPNSYALKETDVVSIDCGVYYKGFHTDSAYTYPMEGVDESILDLLSCTYDSLYIGIEQAKQGNRLGDVGYAIQHHVENFGYGVVRELVGHGVGKNLHESPEVPNYGERGKGVKLEKGMVLAIEPMVNLGTSDIVQKDDGWTIQTKDKSVSAHYEHTIAIGNEEAKVMTTYEYIEENYIYKWRNKNQ